MFSLSEKIEDPCSDNAGQIMIEMQKIPTWTKAKRSLHNELTILLTKNKHICFVGHVDKYHLSIVGESCLYQVPSNRRGHLSIFRGKLISLVCIGSGRYTRSLLATEYKS
jgi:hypothetical protein